LSAVEKLQHPPEDTGRIAVAENSPDLARRITKKPQNLWQQPLIGRRRHRTESHQRHQIQQRREIQDQMAGNSRPAVYFMRQAAAIGRFETRQRRHRRKTACHCVLYQRDHRVLGAVLIRNHELLLLPLSRTSTADGVTACGCPLVVAPARLPKLVIVLLVQIRSIERHQCKAVRRAPPTSGSLREVTLRPFNPEIPLSHPSGVRPRRKIWNRPMPDASRRHRRVVVQPDTLVQHHIAAHAPSTTTNRARPA
jgi:hypothetical protein